MPDWGQSKAGMNTKANADEPKKRRKEDEPDGPVGRTLQYLKTGFLPTVERVDAEEKYEREQAAKRKNK